MRPLLSVDVNTSVISAERKSLFIGIKIVRAGFQLSGEEVANKEHCAAISVHYALRKPLRYDQGKGVLTVALLHFVCWE